MNLLPFIPKERRIKPYLFLEIGLLYLRLYSIQTSIQSIEIDLLDEKQIQPGNVSALMGAIRNILSTDSPVRDLAIVMNSPMIHHQIIEIPPMSSSRRNKVLVMEANHSSTSNEPPGAISFWSFGKVKDSDTVKEHVLCAMLSRTVAEAVPPIIQEKGFNWIGFSSHAQFVVHLLRDSRSKKDRNVALVEVNRTDSGVTLFNANIWNMERHFPLNASENPSDEEIPDTPDLEKLKLEVGRALQYFKQQVRNENIGQIYLFGATQHSAEISTFLETSFKIPVTPLTQDDKKFVVKTGGERIENPILLTIPHSVALHADFKKYIDFVPPELRGKSQSRVQRRIIVGAALILYALLGILAYSVHQEAQAIASQKHADESLSALKSSFRTNGGQLKTDRIFAYAAERSSLWQYRRNRILSEMARELAATVTENMRIMDLGIEGLDNGWQVRMDAEIRSTNGSRSQQILHRFQSQMHQQSILSHLQWESVHVNDSIAPSTAGASADASVDESLLTFSMRGTLQFPRLQNELE